MKKMNEKDFLKIVDATPLVSIDLVVRNTTGEILLGKRVNRPAKGYWFVPGGRIRKNERLSEAMQRIAEAELGISIKLSEAELLGVYEHIYDDNFFEEEGINTHYVVLGYAYELDDSIEVTLDQQHSEAIWWSVDDLLNSAEVHDNTKAYFTDKSGV